MAAKQSQQTPRDNTPASDGSGGHQSSDTTQGMAGSARRGAARGRDEFQGNGDSADLDTGRTEQAGRHYGRSGPEVPGPHAARGPLQPAQGTVTQPENQGVTYDDLRTPEEPGAIGRTQGTHEQTFAQGRDAGQRKQMLPEDTKRRPAK